MATSGARGPFSKPARTMSVPSGPTVERANGAREQKDQGFRIRTTYARTGDRRSCHRAFESGNATTIRVSQFTGTTPPHT